MSTAMALVGLNGLPGVFLAEGRHKLGKGGGGASGTVIIACCITLYLIKCQAS